MKRQLVAMLSLVAGTAVCQPPKDVDGWNKIKWGMTVVEAKAALGDQAPPDVVAQAVGSEAAPETTASGRRSRHPIKGQASAVRPTASDPLKDRIVIPDFKIDGMVAVVAVRSEKDSDVISVVEIRCGLSFSPGFKSPNPSEKDKFALMKQLLMEKYGAPISEEHHPPSESKAVWIFPSTSITLLWADTSGMLKAGLVGSVTISYKMLKKEDVL